MSFTASCMEQWRTNEPGTSVGSFLELLQQRTAKVPHEVGAFLVLQACEAVLERPSLVRPDNIWLDKKGNVAIQEVPMDVEEVRITSSLQKLLQELSAASGLQAPPRLQRLLLPEAAKLSLEELHAALVSALIPLNRSASRRVLSRLLREATHLAEIPDSGAPESQKHKEVPDKQLGLFAHAEEIVQEEDRKLPMKSWFSW